MEPQRPLPRLPDSLAADFVLERELATGGMGVIYLARQLSQGRRVALKFIAPDLVADEETRQRFLGEAQVTAKLQHPNIVEVHQSGADGNVMFIVYQFLEGTNLKDLMRDALLPPERLLPLMAQVARAIAFAHGKKVLHRDIKPENVILLKGREEIKVIDFGIAYESGRKTLTQAGLIMGTPEYVAPEQAVGNRPTELSDQYALGVTLYEVLSGRLPIEDQNTIDLFTKKIRGQCVPLKERVPSLHPAICACVDRTLQVDPKKRFPSVAALADELDRLGNISYVRRPGAKLVPGPAPHVTQTPRLDSSSPLINVLQTTKSAVLKPVRRIVPTAIRTRLEEGVRLHGLHVLALVVGLAGLAGAFALGKRLSAIPPPSFTGLTAAASLDGLTVRWPGTHPGPAVLHWWAREPRGEVHEVPMHKGIEAWDASVPEIDESPDLLVQVAVGAPGTEPVLSDAIAVACPRGRVRDLAHRVAGLDLSTVYAPCASAPASAPTVDAQRQALLHDLTFALKRHAAVIEAAQRATAPGPAQEPSLAEQALHRPDIAPSMKADLLGGLTNLALLDNAAAALASTDPSVKPPQIRARVDALMQWNFMEMKTPKAAGEGGAPFELITGAVDGASVPVTVVEKPDATETILDMRVVASDRMCAAMLELTWPKSRLTLALAPPIPADLRAMDTPFRGGATVRLDPAMVPDGTPRVTSRALSLRGLCQGRPGYSVEGLQITRPTQRP